MSKNKQTKQIISGGTKGVLIKPIKDESSEVGDRVQLAVDGRKIGMTLEEMLQQMEDFRNGIRR